MPAAPVKALIFDFDGLIVDTESSIFEAWRELYASQGQELSLQDYINCVGSTFAAYNPMTVLEDRCDHDIDWPPLLEKKDVRIKELQENLKPLPGVAELLEDAEKLHVPCAVASSSEATWVVPWLKKLNLHEAFSGVHTRCQGHSPKPAPDLFLSAANDLGHAPSDTLVFEDSANGLAAAQAAGAPCWIIPNKVTRGSDFSKAHRILDSLHEVALGDLI